MKKSFLLMGLACLFMVACNNAPKQQETTEPQEDTVAVEEHHCPFCPLKAEYANWDQMDDNMKAELNQRAFDLFAQMDAEMEAHRAECQTEGEAHQCQHEMEMTEEQMAECQVRCEEMKAAWANFANLSADEQKDLVLSRIESVMAHRCHHEGEEAHECCHHEGEEGHECQHAAE